MKIANLIVVVMLASGTSIPKQTQVAVTCEEKIDFRLRLREYIEVSLVKVLKKGTRWYDPSKVEYILDFRERNERILAELFLRCNLIS